MDFDPTIYDYAKQIILQNHRHLFDNFIPDKLAQNFISKENCFIFDFHKTVQTEDRYLLWTPKHNVFKLVYAPNIEEAVSHLEPPPNTVITNHEIGCYWEDHVNVNVKWNQTRTQRLHTLLVEKKILFMQNTHLLLFSCGGIDEELAEFIKDNGGYVIIVEEKAEEVIDGDDDAICAPAHRGIEIVAALNLLKNTYIASAGRF